MVVWMVICKEFGVSWVPKITSGSLCEVDARAWVSEGESYIEDIVCGDNLVALEGAQGKMLRD